MRVKPFFVICLTSILLLLVAGCNQPAATGSGEYDHLKERYGFYENNIFIVLSPEQPDEDFVAARNALRGTEIPKSYEMFEEILAGITGDTPEEKLQKAHCLNAMGISKTITSEYLLAEECFTQAEALYLKAEGSDSISATLCRQNWAILYLHQNRYEEMEALMKITMEKMERQLPENHPAWAATYLLYSLNLNNLGELDAQKAYSQKAYEIAKEAYGENDLITYTCRAGMFMALRVQGFGNAKDSRATSQFYQEQLAYAEQELGEEHPYVASVLLRMAISAMQAEDYSEEILNYLNRAEIIFENAYGGMNDAAFYICAYQGLYYILIGENEKALEPYAKGIPILEQKNITGQRNRQYAHAIGSVGNVYIYMMEPEKAIPYFAKGAYILMTYTDEDVDTIASFVNALRKAYEYCNYSDEPFEEWFEAEMERQAEQIDQPLPVEGYEYLYE